MSYHDHKTLVNLGQKEALLNEYKGNLFEFLVAKELATLLKKESFFLSHLSRDLLERLRLYQETLLEYDRDLYQKLPVLAKDFVKELYASWSDDKKNEFLSIDEIFLLGKLAANSGERLWKEADILLRSGSGINFEIPISLKLSKKGSYTNTKSAGIMSFFTTYFEVFDEKYQKPLSIHDRQARFNLLLDNSFDQMALMLYREKALVYEGGFGPSYLNHYSDLPGELQGQDREILMEHYKRLAKALVDELKELSRLDSQLFTRCLFDLMGFSSEETRVWTCYHQDHLFYEAHEESLNGFAKLCATQNDVTFLPLEGAGSVNIKLVNLTLQLRIKPMNKFTTKAYKVNCSIKWH